MGSAVRESGRAAAVDFCRSLLLLRPLVACWWRAQPPRCSPCAHHAPPRPCPTREDLGVHPACQTKNRARTGSRRRRRPRRRLPRTNRRRRRRNEDPKKGKMGSPAASGVIASFVVRSVKLFNSLVCPLHLTV